MCNLVSWLKMQILPSLFLQHYMQSYDAVIMTLVQDRQDKPHGSRASAVPLEP
jgi:hypothetical protein